MAERPRLLDLTRLVSRVGSGPLTGIDRVEAAYLARLLEEPGPLFGLVRTSLGFVLLDRTGMRALQVRLLGAEPWGAADMLSRVFLRSEPLRRQAESHLRRSCVARAGRGGLARMLARNLPKGTIWLNTGHTNLAPHVFAAVHEAGGQAHVLVHDTIPLDHPEFQRPGTVEVFERRLRAVQAQADLVIYNSAVSRRDAERYFVKWGRVPQAVVAHLGVEVAAPEPAALPSGLDLSGPYFVTTGTIEPRKNHAFLLDLWEQLAHDRVSPMPHLFIIGKRGWNNEAVFARLDARPQGIAELNGLSDGAMAALIRGARAALFPSLAEGFGLPPCEAYALGVQVVANDLEATREVLGNIPIYASVSDMYSWRKTITALATDKTAKQTEARQSADRARTLPTWQDHFNQVLTVS